MPSLPAMSSADAKTNPGCVAKGATGQNVDAVAR